MPRTLAPSPSQVDGRLVDDRRRYLAAAGLPDKPVPRNYCPCVDLTQGLTAGGVLLALVGAGIAAFSAVYAGRQAKSAKQSADATLQMAAIDARRRHDELAPIWEPPTSKTTSGTSSWQVGLTLQRGQLDHLVLEIIDSPHITFDVSRQADAVADRLERHAPMTPGAAAKFWVKIGSGHERKLRLRATASLSGEQWEPVLLPTLEIVVPGADEDGA